jgi:chaperonin GroEL (HSP60 family)
VPNISVTNVFSPNYERIKGKDAWQNNLRLTTFAAERVRSSLGPNGAYKMVTYNRGPEKIVKITRDAVAVLEELAIQFPTVTVLSEAAKIQRQEVGDGVTSFVVFTSALLKKADELVAKRIHPTTILRGYLEAEKKALEIIEANAKTLKNDALCEDLLETVDCGRNLLTTEMRRQIRDASEIATKDGKMDKTKIRFIRKPGGTTAETQLVQGIAIKKGKVHPNMPDDVSKPRIAVTSGRIGLNRVDVKMPSEGRFRMQFTMDCPEKLAACQDAEKNLKTEALEKLGVLPVDVLFCQQPIGNFAKSKLLEMGVLAFESVDKSDLAAVSKATGAKVVSNLVDLTKSDVGAAEKLETERIGLEKIVTLNCPGYATFILRGSTLQALNELELVIQNGLTLLQTARRNRNAVAGGGATEIHVARQLGDFAKQFSGREQLTVEGFAQALMEIPRCLAVNNGFHADDVLAQLGKFHAEGFADYGVGVDGCGSGVCVELAEVKKSMIRRAFEVASLLLRIDEQVVSKETLKFHKK